MIDYLRLTIYCYQFIFSTCSVTFSCALQEIMKEWLRPTQDTNSKRTRSTSHTRQFRQQITKFTKGMPQHHYLAYCLVSKQSSMGLFLNERLLLLDSLKLQLKYYSHIPALPLGKMEDLPAAKQTINLKQTSLFQFLPQKIRIGHVAVRWSVKGAVHSWKLIMGSNRIAKQFSQLLDSTISSYKGQIRSAKHQQFQKNIAHSRKTQQSTNIKQQPTLSKQRQSSQRYQVAVNSNNIQRIFNEQKPSLSPEHRLSVSIQQNHDFRIYSQQQRQSFSQNIFNPLQIKKPTTTIKHPHQNLIIEWLNCQTHTQRAQIYHMFTLRCINKIQSFMENYLTNHLTHQKEGNNCLVIDGEIQIIYCPLVIDSEDETSSQILFNRIQLQEEMLRQWQSLSYLSGISCGKDYKICVALSCLIEYKSFKFHCRHSIDSITNKVKVTNIYLYKSQLQHLQNQLRLKIVNGKQQIYLIQHQQQSILYFTHLQCLPYLPTHPISAQYVRKYIHIGVVNNQKDIQTIIQHIDGTLIAEAGIVLRTKSVHSSVQLMELIAEVGLTHHQLPYLVGPVHQEEKNQYSFLQKRILTEIIACAMEWQIRRKMQTQFYRRREFGFAINQLKLSLSLLLQFDKYFISVLLQHIQSYFKYTFPTEVNFNQIMLPQCVVMSVLNRLSLNCKVTLYKDDSADSWVWNELTMTNNLQITAILRTVFYNFDCFSLQATKLKQQLLDQVNYQPNRNVDVNSVLTSLNIHQNKQTQEPSPQYLLLPFSLKIKVNYFISHFMGPSKTNMSSFQSLIYSQNQQPHYFTHTIQFLLTLNKARWLIKEGNYDKTEQLLQAEITRATIWKQTLSLIQIYNFYGKLKLKRGEITQTLQYGLKSLRLAIEYYQLQPTVNVQLLIAEQAFESAQTHYQLHIFSKAIDLYSTTENILNKVSVFGTDIYLNPQFIMLYVCKGSIFLLFGQYKECVQCCHQGIKCCSKFQKPEIKDVQIKSYEFKLYSLMWRCHQIRNMRKQLAEVASTCSILYFQEPVINNQILDEEQLTQVVKMLWLSIIKNVEAATHNEEKIQSKSKYIYLRKVRKDLISMRKQLNNQYRYNRTQIATYLGRKILKSKDISFGCKLGSQIVKCLCEVTLEGKGYVQMRLYEPNSLESAFVMLQGISVLTGYDYLIGSIENSLHIYHFQS